MRFRLFDRVRRSRDPEPGRAGAAKGRRRESGRHRFRAVIDRSRHAAGPSGGADWRASGPDLAGGAPVRAGRPAWAERDLRGSSARRGLAGTERGAGGGAERGGMPGGDGRAGGAGGERHAGGGVERGGLVGGEGRAGGGTGGGAGSDVERGGLAGAERGAWGGVDRGGADLWRPGSPLDTTMGGPAADGARPDAARRASPPWETRPGGARARIRPSPDRAAPFTSPVKDRVSGGPTMRADTGRASAGRGSRDAAARRPWYEVANPGNAAAFVGRPGSELARPAAHARTDGRPSARDRYVAPHLPDEPHRGDGRRHCGSLEQVLHRQWDAKAPPPAEIVRAIDRLAELPAALKERLAGALDGIFVGPGGVPDLDHMQHLRGVPLPAGRGTWDVCAGAYGGRKIVVGAQPSPTPDVMCHEIGHALDDIDTPGHWQSDQAEFRRLYDQCVPHLVSDFHRQPSGLGRREFFADAFAAIASRQRPALVDMLGGDTRTALNVMLYFDRRFGV